MRDWCRHSDLHPKTKKCACRPQNGDLDRLPTNRKGSMGIPLPPCAVAAGTPRFRGSSQMNPGVVSVLSLMTPLPTSPALRRSLLCEDHEDTTCASNQKLQSTASRRTA